MTLPGLLCTPPSAWPRVPWDIWAAPGKATAEDPSEWTGRRRATGSSWLKPCCFWLLWSLKHPRLTLQRSRTSPRWRSATCRTVCHSARREECQSDWNWGGEEEKRFLNKSRFTTDTKAIKRQTTHHMMRLFSVCSPGVGFGQVVGAGIDLVDGKEPWAGSTWRKKKQSKKPRSHSCTVQKGVFHRRESDTATAHFYLRALCPLWTALSPGVFTL